jgi:imidazolonepropionase-like amidohydrolase
LTGARFGFALIVAGACANASPADTLIVVHAGSLLAVPGTAPKTRQTIVIRDGRIEAVRDGFLTPAQAGGGAVTQVIDLSDQFVLPGLIDLHVHLTTEVDAGEALRALTRTAADLALAARRHAHETFVAGFTTVLDLGTARQAHEEAIFALRDSIESGIAVGPRILAAGSPISPTGSSRTDRFAMDVEAAVEPQAVCDGADSCARVVREQIRRGADVVAFYDSGSLRDKDLAAEVLTDVEMRAIVETAHALNRSVIADGHTAADINAALRAGADVLDTAPWPDDTTWKLLKDHPAFFEAHMHAFVIAAGFSTPVSANSPAEPPVAARVRDVMSKPFSAQLAHEHGVRLAYGSDTGIVAHGDNAGDLVELVRIGLTPMQAIEVATINSATAIGWAGKIGTLEVGKRGDLIATHGNPLEDITALQRIDYVMREGHGFQTH